MVPLEKKVIKEVFLVVFKARTGNMELGKNIYKKYSEMKDSATSRGIFLTS